MEYKHLPKFTNTSGIYSVDIGLSFLPSHIESEIENGLKLNPDFQRGHVWNEQQQIAYMEYLFAGGKSGKDVYFNHPHWMGSFEGDYVCVDGLQRITACLRYMNNEIPIFGYFKEEFTDRIPMDIRLKFNINNLKTRKEVLKWYVEMNTGGVIHSDEEIERVKKLIEKE